MGFESGDGPLTRLLGQVAARLGVHKVYGASVVCRPCHSTRCEGSWARARRWIIDRYYYHHLCHAYGNPVYVRSHGSLAFRRRRRPWLYRTYHYVRRLVLYPYLWRQYTLNERRLKQQEIGAMRRRWRGTPRED